LNKRIINNKYVVLDKTFEIDIKDSREEEINNLKNREELLKSEILKKAKKEAQEIVASARKEAEKIVEEAKQQANKIKQEQMELFNKKQKNLEEHLIKINEEIKKVANEYKIYVGELSNQARAFSEEVIKMVVGKYFEENISFPEWVEVAFEDLQKKLYLFKDATLKVSPSFNKEFLQIIVKTFGNNFQIIEDSSLIDNQIFLDTNQGVLDLSPQTFVKDILNMLEGSLNEES